MDNSNDLRHRQFFWGLSNGVIVLAIATGFWFGIAAASGSGASRTWMGALACALELALLAAAIRMRRKAAGFGITDLRKAEGHRREEIRKMRICFRWNTGAQTLLVGTAVGLAMHYHRQDLVWPAIALVVSLHFIPLAWIFRVRIYYAMAAAGAVISVAAFLAAAAGVDASARTVFLGLGMGTCVSATAVYAVLRADRMVTVWDDAS